MLSFVNPALKPHFCVGTPKKTSSSVHAKQAALKTLLLFYKT